MILPKNGRVVILDDKKEQAYPLINVLSKNKVPFTYHSDDISQLPEEGQQYDDIRFLFLDINLSDSGASEDTIKSQLQTTLLRIVKPGTPYVAVIWSLNESQYEDLLIDLFNNRIPEIQPLKRISIAKSDFFDLDITGHGTEYVERSDINLLDGLKRKISASLEQLDSIEALIKWENVISTASSSIILEIVSLARKNGDLNHNLKDIYYKLAEAMWGRQLEGNHPHKITNKAIAMMNLLLNDKIESDVSKGLNYQLINEINTPESFSEIDKALLNTKILLNIEPTNELLPGNVHQISNENINQYPYKALTADLINIPHAVEKFYFEKNGEKVPRDFNYLEYKNTEKKEFAKFEKGLRQKITASSLFINLEISPICDYAQKKWRAHRICPGLLWRNEFSDYIGKADSLYVSPSLLYKNDIYRLVLDFRYFSSLQCGVLKQESLIFSLRHSFLVDIQSLLGRHVNRPGISALI